MQSKCQKKFKKSFKNKPKKKAIQKYFSFLNHYIIITNNLNYKIQQKRAKSSYSITLKYSPESKYNMPFLLLNSLIISK